MDKPAPLRKQSPLHCRAYAKLNLFLHLLRQRADGYHELQTLFQLIDLYDELLFQPRSDGSITLTSNLSTLPVADNLITKAARALQAHLQPEALEPSSLQSSQGTHIKPPTPGVSIQLNKRIPMGAGMGGGSSDAAVTLLALNQLWELHLPLSRLSQIGLSLGADVPIFLAQHSAWATGVGELLQPTTLSPCYYLIVKPPIHASTAELFQHPALHRSSAAIPIDQYPCPISPIHLVHNQENAFAPILRTTYPLIDQLLAWLGQFGPAQITGTGSSCFVPIEQFDQAHIALKKTEHYINTETNTLATVSQQASGDQATNSDRCQLFLTEGKNNSSFCHLGVETEAIIADNS